MAGKINFPPPPRLSGGPKWQEMAENDGMWQSKGRKIEAIPATPRCSSVTCPPSTKWTTNASLNARQGWTTEQRMQEAEQRIGELEAENRRLRG